MQAMRQFPQDMHSDEVTGFPRLIYEATSTSMGQALPYFPQPVQGCPDGFTGLINAILV
jgi:hypothetical protein